LVGRIVFGKTFYVAINGIKKNFYRFLVMGKTFKNFKKEKRYSRKDELEKRNERSENKYKNHKTRYEE
jgi:hypothetical protein